MYQNQNPNLVSRFEDWWQRKNKGLPLMEVVAVKDNANWTAVRPEKVEDWYLNADYLLAAQKDRLNNCIWLGDAYASLSADIGPGSLALYLGAEPRFSTDTVWYEPCIDDIETEPVLAFDPENKWWKTHVEMVKKLRAAAGKDFLVNIPDLIENIDIYSAMRGPENTLYDIMDEPEKVERAIARIDDTYFRYYDELLSIVQDDDGIAAYTVFGILGKGRVAKIQCDFSAMISPAQFRQFVLPSLKKQAKKLDHSLYHLDGPDAIRHVPAIMEIGELDALQWTCGAGQPDGACPRWYPIYDDVTAAGKGLWIQIYDGKLDDWIRSSEALMNRYGTGIFYFHYPWMKEAEAEKLMAHAEKHWK